MHTISIINHHKAYERSFLKHFPSYRMIYCTSHLLVYLCKCKVASHTTMKAKYLSLVILDHNPLSYLRPMFFITDGNYAP